MNLKELRRLKQYTQKQLSLKLGVHYQTIQAWESGKTQIPDKRLDSLAAIFNIDLEEIIKLKYNFTTKIGTDFSAQKNIPQKKNKFANYSLESILILLDSNTKILAKIQNGLNHLIAKELLSEEDLKLLNKYRKMEQELLADKNELKSNL